MIKSKQIKWRILKTFLCVSIISLLVTSLLAEFNIFSMRSMMLESNGRIGSSAAKSSEEALSAQAVANATEMAYAKATNINVQLTEVAKVVSLISNYTNYLYTHKDEFQPIPYNHPMDNIGLGPEMQWVLPEDIDFESVRDELYLHGNMRSIYDSVMKSNNSIRSIYFTTETGINSGFDDNSRLKPRYFDGRKSSWYTKTKKKNSLMISQAYQDTFGRGLTVSMYQPCYGENGVMVGVMGLDILIESLNENIIQTSLGGMGYALMYAKDGTIISAPDMDNAPSSDKLLLEAGDVCQLTLNGQQVYRICAPIPIADWRVVVIMPVEKIVAPAIKTRTYIEHMTGEMAESINEQILWMNLGLVALFAIVVVGVIAVTVDISKKITEPIIRLTHDVKQTGTGYLSYVSQIHTGDEIEDLSLSFEHMTKMLREYIENLSCVTAEKERISTELNVAKQIQSSMLPCIFPPFPDRSEFDIYATMHPAKEVGGDFYDFYLIDDSHLGVVIADVSGKGVPAALFMVIAKTLIKNYAQLGISPAEVFQRANIQLCESNDAGMFVTAFMAVLDLATGKFTYVNAGHNPPLIARFGGKYEWLKLKPGFVLAGMEEINYTQNECILYPGDQLFLYTDGVTEALNQDKELYSESRLLSLFNSGVLSGKSTSEVLKIVQEDLSNFAGGADQADDITMLLLKINK